MNENLMGKRLHSNDHSDAKLHVFGVFRTFAYFNFMGQTIKNLQGACFKHGYVTLQKSLRNSDLISRTALQFSINARSSQ